jgi:intermediate cleaving peptidase 55
MTQYP